MTSRPTLWTTTLLAGLLSPAGCVDDRTSGGTGQDNLQARVADDGRSPNNPRRGRDGRRDRETTRGDRTGRYPTDLRTFDGSGNNLRNPDWGRAGVAFLRRVPAAYADGRAAPSGPARPGARVVSNRVTAVEETAPSGASDMLWQWGQFLDHDLDLSPEVDPAEHFDIAVPAGDLHFDPAGTGAVTLPLGRSLFETVGGVREQINAISAFIDASNVYGSDAARARALRAGDGSGRLATSPGNLLPFNTMGLDNAAPGQAPPEAFYVAGDFRANEQVGLTVMHTLFVREHNRWVDRLRADDPSLDGDALYDRARAIVGAEMQAITYREFLPVLLGRDAIPEDRGYDPSVDPGISNLFATAAYRVGHSMLSQGLLRLGPDGQSLPGGELSLAEAFFAPERLRSDGLEPYLRGLAAGQAQAIDLVVVDEVRNFLFGPPGAGGLDLVSLNVQRGRDHGLPSYGAVRAAFGRQPPETFADISPRRDVQDALRSAYARVEDVDPWVGMLAEPARPGALVGETMYRVLRDQFVRLRDGDRFWYTRHLPPELVREVEARRLSVIIRDVTGAKVPQDPFRVN